MFIDTMYFEIDEERRLSDTIYLYIEKVNKKSLRIKITETDGLQITNQISRNVKIKEEINRVSINFNYDRKRYRIDKLFRFDEDRSSYLQKQIQIEKLKEIEFHNKLLADYYRV